MYPYPSHGKALLFQRCDGVATRAFTLIELLVVLAVLAVVSALMVPVLAGTKGEVWRAGCRNQMGQIGRGFRLFSFRSAVNEWTMGCFSERCQRFGAW
jgi:prepilin-type N-terminal cleavage/methylation domain-containing protein